MRFVTSPRFAHRTGRSFALATISLPRQESRDEVQRIGSNCDGSPVHATIHDDGRGNVVNLRHGQYCVRHASSESDRLAAFRLRFAVFNLELKEGLESAYATGHDSDQFDPVYDHLIVEHSGTGEVVGTYRLQTGLMAKANLGYYSEREFQFAPYEPLRDQVMELGRACIHREHRSTDVLNLLWRGIAQYSLLRRARYLIGCSSLTSQNPAHGAAVYESLRKYVVEPGLRTEPQREFRMPLAEPTGASDKVPKLLAAYLAIGARICGPPAIDREFKTIDFLTLLDLQGLHPRIRARFLRGI
jgi:putative hemolysin